MGISSQTRYNAFKRIDARLSDIHGITVRFKSTADEYYAMLKKLRESDDYKKLTMFYSGIIEGKTDAFYDMLNTSHQNFNAN